MKNKIPVIITCDVDPSIEISTTDKRKSFERSLNLFDNLKIPATYLFVANAAKIYASEFSQMLNFGHEIGCHGLTHGLEEEYNRMPEKKQREYLTKATRILEQLAGKNINTFRGPRVKTSHITQAILQELNYLVDTSICSQRLDFISSNLIHTGWIFAPRLPYQPALKNAYKKGNRKLCVVPVSALILPFISSVLYAFGIGLMKKFFDVLYFESKRNGKPIVYLMHPVEFAVHGKLNEKTTLQSIKRRGFYCRRKLKLRIDEKKRYEYTEKLFQYIIKFEDVKLMTMSSYVLSSQTALLSKN